MTLPPHPDPKNPAPFLSHSPWAGFSPREHARPHALGLCPSKRCRRLKACVAAHDGVFCQRTHISHAEYLAAQPRAPSLFKGRSAEELEFFRLTMLEKIAERKEQHDALTARWKAGEFDALYGKWRAKGALMHPPAKVFVALRKGRGKLHAP